ncbi:unnamed protein product [Amoebophrya sp. A120]|nr:unnamed protein product [Amoebophrya sp. A120]|eukprot:GSA120T00005535001.1
MRIIRVTYDERAADSVYRQIGLQIGAQAKDQVHTALDTDHEFKHLKAWLSRDPAHYEITFGFIAKSREAFPQYMEELEAIAEAAGVLAEDLIISNLRTELLQFKRKADADYHAQQYGEGEDGGGEDYEHGGDENWDHEHGDGGGNWDGGGDVDWDAGGGDNFHGEGGGDQNGWDESGNHGGYWDGSHNSQYTTATREGRADGRRISKPTIARTRVKERTRKGNIEKGSRTATGASASCFSSQEREIKYQFGNQQRRSGRACTDIFVVGTDFHEIEADETPPRAGQQEPNTSSSQNRVGSFFRGLVGAKSGSAATTTGAFDPIRGKVVKTSPVPASATPIAIGPPPPGVQEPDPAVPQVTSTTSRDDENKPAPASPKKESRSKSKSKDAATSEESRGFAKPFHGWGHNNDWSEDFKHLDCVVECYNRENVFQWVSWTYPGFLVGMDLSLNKHGIAYSINSLYPVKFGESGVGLSFLTRRLLEVKTLDEALQVITDERSTTGFSYNLGSFRSKIMWNVETSDKGQHFLTKIDDKQLPGFTFFHGNEYVAAPHAQCPYFDDMSTKYRRNMYQMYFPNQSDSCETKTKEGLIQRWTKNVLSSKKPDAKICHRRTYNIEDVRNFLGDDSDHHFPVYRTWKEEDPVLTEVSGIFDLGEGVFHLFDSNPAWYDAKKSYRVCELLEDRFFDASEEQEGGPTKSSEDAPMEQAGQDEQKTGP